MVTKGFTMWEVSWRLNRTATYWPHFYGHNSVSFSFSRAAQPGSWRVSLSVTWSSFQHLLSNWSEFQLLNRGSEGPLLLGACSLYSILSLTDLNFLSPGLYNNLTTTLLPANVTISHSIQPLNSQGHILIFFDGMHRLFTHVNFLFRQFGLGQYATIIIYGSRVSGTINEKDKHPTLQLSVGSNWKRRLHVTLDYGWSTYRYIYIYIYIYA